MATKSWLIFILVAEGFCAPPEPTTTSTKQAAVDSSSAEFSVPTNMNMADYYYSIFGKHLDYDYREPILTFDEPAQNELSNEKSSEANKGPDPWDLHSRKKRFAFLSRNLLNTTRQWSQQRMKLRMERMRLRNQRRRQWQENRIKYLNSRSAALQRQSALLTQLQQQQQRQITRSTPTGSSQKNSTVTVIKFSLTSTPKPTTMSSRAPNLNINTIPVRQVPIPTKQ